MEPEQQSQPPRRSVGGYELLAVLGSGGMGTVYEALDADNRHVALKLLHPGFSADDEARARLRREVAALHKVRGAQVARVLDAEVDADEAFIVTELVDGQALDASVREHGPLDAEELADLADGLAIALDNIHAVDVVHRDLKPGNVMLTDAGPIVIDFGISHMADDARLTQAGLVTGTPGYVAPEVLAGADPGIAGDWWGWAAVLVFAATGRAPFGTGPLAAVLGRVETGRVDVEGLPPRVAQVLRRALHPDPAVRLAPESVIRALDDHVHGREPTQYLSPADLDVEAPGTAAGTAVLERDTTRAPADVSAPAPMPAVVPPVPTRQPLEPGPAPVSARVPPSPAAGVGPGMLPAGADTAIGAGNAPPGPAVGPQVQAWAAPAPARPGVTFALWCLLAAIASVIPGLALLAFAAYMILAGTIGSVGRALRQRRLRHGVRRSDVAVASISTPVHIVMSTALLLPGAIVGVLGGGIVWGLASSQAGTQAVLMTALLVAVNATLTLLTWWTPTSSAAREGTASAVRLVLPGRGARAIAVALLLVAAVAVIAVAVISGVDSVWAPLPAPPIPMFVS